jgi:hypothetical protein
MLNLIKKYKKTFVALAITAAGAAGIALNPELAGIISEVLSGLADVAAGLAEGANEVAAEVVTQ